MDLGSGTGLPCAVAAVMFPELLECEGIEYLQSITTLGQKAMQKV